MKSLTILRVGENYSKKRMCFGEMRSSNQILSQIKAATSGFQDGNENKTTLGYRLILVRNRQRNTKKVSSVHTVTVPHTTMFLSYKGPIVGQSKVALNVNPVCKGLFVLNINARMLKQRSNQRPLPQNNKREKQSIHHHLVFKLLILNKYN